MYGLYFIIWLVLGYRCAVIFLVSYLVYAGLVFVSLSQPYMQHQYGKDWARKAPIRLCDRVLYGILNQTGQEVILLSQVNS